MNRREALTCLTIAGALLAAGLVWLFGPYGLIVSGLALAALVLFGVDITDPEVRRRGETVEPAAGTHRT